MRLAINSSSRFWKFLTSIFDPMGDLGPKLTPKFGTLGTEFILLVGPRNYVSFLRVISIEKPSWIPFPIWAWLCDQLSIYSKSCIPNVLTVCNSISMKNVIKCIKSELLYVNVKCNKNSFYDLIIYCFTRG